MTGVHRFYLGHNTIGDAQLGLTVVGLFCCPVGFVTLPVAWVWAVIDLVLIAATTRGQRRQTTRLGSDSRMRPAPGMGSNSSPCRLA